MVDCTWTTSKAEAAGLTLLRPGVTAELHIGGATKDECVSVSSALLFPSSSSNAVGSVD